MQAAIPHPLQEVGPGTLTLALYLGLCPPVHTSPLERPPVTQEHHQREAAGSGLACWHPSKSRYLNRETGALGSPGFTNNLSFIGVSAALVIRAMLTLMPMHSHSVQTP